MNFGSRPDALAEPFRVPLAGPRGRAGRLPFCLSLCALLCLTASVARGDGKVFVRETARVRIPDQSALICYDGKTERLVIETAFEGEGSEFAWVVPVPSLPEVEAATSGIFPTLRSITRPRILSHSGEWDIGVFLALGFGVVMWIGIFTNRRGEAAALAFLGIVLAGLLLPALGDARSRSSARTGVVVHERKMAGAYESATLSGGTGVEAAGVEIVGWLNENGFTVPQAVLPVIEDYAREGWYFVAARLRSDTATDGRAVTHPLSLSFQTDRPVYPMRLTGVDNGPLTLDLYVVGEKEATVAGLKRQRAAVLHFIDEEERGAPWYGEDSDNDSRVPVVHPALRSYAEGARALTLLSGTLTPEAQRDDLYIEWQPLKPYRQVFHTTDGAIARACQWAAGLFAGITLICAVAFGRGERQPVDWAGLGYTLAAIVASAGVIAGASLISLHVFLEGVACLTVFLPATLWFGWQMEKHQRVQPTRVAPRSADRIVALLRAVLAAVLVPAVTGIVIFLVTPRYKGETTSSYKLYRLQDYHETTAAALNVRENRDTEETLTDLRSQARHFWEQWSEEDRTNQLTGLTVREEDSPGNYTLGLHGAKPAYFYYDVNGQRMLVHLFGEPTALNPLSEF